MKSDRLKIIISIYGVIFLLIAVGMVFLFKYDSPELGLFSLFFGAMLLLVVIALRIKENKFASDAHAKTTSSMLYVNSNSLLEEYGHLIVFFIIILMILFIQLYLLIDFAKRPIDKIVFSVFCLILLVILLYIFFYSRKHVVFKIATDDNGITFYGLTKSVFARWHELISADVRSDTSIEVMTKSGKFFFPITMKEIGKRYADAITKPTGPEDCQLYIEIQNRLSSMSSRTIEE